MKNVLKYVFLMLLSALVGCSTTQQVVMAKYSQTKHIESIARSPGEGNSPEMDANLDAALLADGLTVKTTVLPETRKSPGVDAVISYVDTWRWDVVMYLQQISINLYDANTGDLIMTGEWHNSALHGFQDAKLIVRQVVTDMMTKLDAAANSGESKTGG